MLPERVREREREQERETERKFSQVNLVIRVHAQCSYELHSLVDLVPHYGSYFLYLKWRGWLVGGLSVRHDPILIRDVAEPAPVHWWMLAVAE